MATHYFLLRLVISTKCFATSYSYISYKTWGIL